MTVEEIEIIVTAKVEEALKEFKKMLPQIKQEMSKIQKELGQVDFNGLAKQVKASGIDKELSKVKQKIKETFNPADVSGLKMQGIKQEISGVSKEVQKLKGSSEQLGNAYDLQRYKQKMQELKTETQNANKEVSKVGHVKYDTKAIQKFIDSYKQGNSDTKVNTPNVSSSNVSTNIQPSQQSLGLWDTLKAKIQQIKPQVKQAQSMFNNMSINPNTKQLNLIKYKISEIEEKLQNAKEGKIHLDTKDIVKAEAELERLNNQKQKLERNTDSRGNMFSTIFSSLKKITPQMNNISGIAVKVKNNIKLWDGGIRQGIGQIARYATALFGLQSIYSTLSSCANSWLSSQNSGAKQLSANIEYMKYAMGSALAPVIQYVTNLVYQLLKAIQSVVYALTGVNIFANASSKAYNSMAKSAGKAAKSSKEASNSLANFDEIHNIQKDTGSGSGGESAGGSVTPSMDLSNLENINNSFLNAIKNGNWEEIGIILGEKLNEQLQNIPWDKIQEYARKIGAGIAQTLNGFIATTDWNQVGSTLAQGLNTIIYFGYNFVTSFDWKQFGKAIGSFINGGLLSIDWATAGQTLSTGLIGIFDTLKTAVSTIDWAGIANEICIFIASIDWTGIVNSWYSLIGNMAGAVWSFIGQTFKDIFKGIYEFFSKEVEECGGNIIEGILKGIGDAIVGIAKWIDENIFKPFIEGFKNSFGIHSPSTIMVEMGGYIIEGLKNGILDLKEKLGEAISTVCTKVKDWFKDKLSNNKFIQTGKNVIEGIKNGLKNNSNIYTAVTDVTEKAKNMFTSFAEQAKTWGKDLVSNMATGIKNNVKKVTNAVSSVADKIKGFLGFSEPDVGPLSNFHTYMPDMIDLMVDGIHSNIKKVTKELETLTKNMSYTINTDSISNIPIIQYNTTSLQTKSAQENVLYENIKKALANNGNTGNNETINFENKLVVNGKVFAREIIEDLNGEAVRRGYKPILQH